MAESDFREATLAEAEGEAAEFSLFEAETEVIVSVQRRLARDLAFRLRVKDLYANRCSVCGASMMTLDRRSEIEAAHIVPRQYRGADDARNGIALCRRHHWAFDNGLFSIGPARTVLVPKQVSGMPENKELAELQGVSISEANDTAMFAHANAFAWHWLNVACRNN